MSEDTDNGQESRADSEDPRKFAGLTRKQLVGAGIGVALLSGALVLWGFLSSWHGDTSLAVAGLTISVLGFAVALAEIHRARRETRTTREAVDKALALVDRSRLAIRLTELQGLVETIEDASDGGEPKLLRHSVNRWRILAGSAIGLMERKVGTHSAIPPLRKSIRLARAAKDRTYEDATSEKSATAEFIAAMNEAADELGPLTEQLITTMESADA